MDDDHAIIEDGLDADSLVVSNWSSKLRNGADAEIVSLNGESVASPEQEQEEEATEDTPADEMCIRDRLTEGYIRCSDNLLPGKNPEKIP